MDPIQDKKSAFKLAQLQAALSDGSCIKIIDRILEKEGDINFATPAEGFYEILLPYSAGRTALHLASIVTLESFKNLLNHGADFTKKNSKGKTVLHILIKKAKVLEGPSDDSFLNAVLSSHVSFNNFSNPCNENGLSHFHIACMTTHSEAVKYFLDNGVSVDEPVGLQSEIYSGYTPLHFAAVSANIEVAEILISYGANMHLTDAKGMTPLHLLIENRMRMYNSICDFVNKRGNAYEKLQFLIGENEKIINMLMENTSSDNDCVDSIGFSNFHVACVLQDNSAVQHIVDQVVNLNQCISVDSQLWPGYTALHFAAHNSMKKVEMLINEGANLAAEDVKGLTPLDICIERYETQDIHRIMSFVPMYENLFFSDGVTKVLSFIQILTDLKLFEKFVNCSTRNINAIIPLDSPLWPGYTVLHLAVLFAEESKQTLCENREAKREVDVQMIRLCLENKADITAQDSRGRTALNLAFRLNKMGVVDLILRHCPKIPNVLDEDHLSHLHIVCAVSKTKHLLTEKYDLNNASEVNLRYEGTSIVNAVKPGSTPLHVCIANPYDNEELRDLMNILLEYGADPHVKDAYGLTPIHWLLKYRSFYKCEMILSQVSRNCVADEYGFGHLHVASQVGDVDTVRRLLLEDGTDVNLAIKYTQRSAEDPLSFLARYDKCMALHVCPLDGLDKLELLLQCGADICARSANGCFALEESSFLYEIVPKVWCNVDMERLVERQFGWTRLHLACFLLIVDGFQSIVIEATSVNAQVFSNSPIWKGCTPLHLLMSHEKDRQVKEKAEPMLRMLLESGADVTVTDDEQDTPVAVLFKYPVNCDKLEYAALLMKYQRDFSANPVSSHGVSHFHLACHLNDLDAVRGFLSHGVDVNSPVDYFSYWYPGYTALHLASQVRVVDLLLSHGADVHVENVDGRTALSEAFARDVFDEDVVAKIIENGADINAPNFRGETPFHSALSKIPITMEKLNFCIRRGFHVNSCNPVTGVGYLPIILSGCDGNKDLQMRMLDVIMNVNSTTLGRTTLHHFVSRRLQMPDDDYNSLLERIIKAGCGVDKQDHEGKTALHVAIDSEETKAVSGLLRFGADVNVADKNDNSALSYARIRSCPTNHTSVSVANILTIHACRLSSLKLHLSRKNADIVSSARESIRDQAGNPDFEDQVNLSKGIQLGVRSICLHDILSGIRAFTMYRFLNQTERCQIDWHFDVIDNDNRFRAIKGFLRLQRRQLVERLELFPSAKSCFGSLLGFHFPDLCAENILHYLCNYDLKSIISAEAENDGTEVDVN